MEKLLFSTFCILNLICTIYSITENVDHCISYDLNGLIKKNIDRYENSMRAKQHDVLQYFKFRGIDEERKFEPSEDLLRNSSKCLGDIIYLLENIKSPWAIKMLDSYGKPESGILVGNVKWLGDWNECLSITSTGSNSSAARSFRGQYCTASLSFIIQEIGVPIVFSSALCLPDSCSPEELEKDVMQFLHIAGTFPEVNGNGAVSPNVTLQCKPTGRHLNNAAIAVIIVLFFFLALTLIGSSITAFKYLKAIIRGYKKTSVIDSFVDSNQFIGDQNDTENGNDDDSPLQDNLLAARTGGILNKVDAFLNCFCVFKNGSKILNTDGSEGELLCIHGIRFLSMAWVILGHSYLFGIMAMRNILDFMQYLDGFLFQILLQAFYSVDSFFVLSGFLLAYLTMNEFAKSNGGISWPYFYMHRYIRLTPIYMILLGFSATVYLYLGSGPYWPDGDIDKICQKNWWKNLLYINNFYDQTEQCMAWTWYLANEMQFFIISPLFLITLWRWPIVGYSMIGVFMFACCLSNFFITYHFELMAGVFSISPKGAIASLIKFLDYFNKIYIKPYTRINPYLIGILTGYLLHKRKQNDYPRHSLVFVCVGWAISIGIGLTCIFVLYHQNPPLIGNSFYNALNRTGFGVSLAWIIYACLVGQGGFVNRILSYKVFIPLSRLTYTAYLIHPMVIIGYFASMKQSFEFSHTSLVCLFLGFLAVTYLLSLPVALMLESPVIALEKWIRKSFTKPRKIETVN